MQLDFTNVQMLDTNPVPAGQYPIQVTQCKPTQSKTGKAMIEWRFRISEGDYQNRQLFMNTVLELNSLWKLKQTLIGLGFTEEDLAGQIQFEPSEMVGLEAYAAVTQREYNGAMRNNVERLISIDAVAEQQAGANGVFSAFTGPNGNEAGEEAVMPEWGADKDLDFSQNQTNGTAAKTAQIVSQMGAATAIAEAPTAVAVAEEDEDEEEEEAVPEVMLEPTKAAARLAETYNVTLQDIYAYTGKPQISKQDVLDFVASRQEDEDDEE